MDVITSNPVIVLSVCVILAFLLAGLLLAANARIVRLFDVRMSVLDSILDLQAKLAHKMQEETTRLSTCVDNRLKFVSSAVDSDKLMPVVSAASKASGKTTRVRKTATHKRRNGHKRWTHDEETILRAEMASARKTSTGVTKAARKLGRTPTACRVRWSLIK